MGGEREDRGEEWRGGKWEVRGKRGEGSGRGVGEESCRKGRGWRRGETGGRKRWRTG